MVTCVCGLLKTCISTHLHCYPILPSLDVVVLMCDQKNTVKSTLCHFKLQKKLKIFLSKSKGCRVVKSTTGPQCNLTRNKESNKEKA